MRYMLLFHYSEEDEQSVGKEAIAAGKEAFAKYVATLEASGVLVAAEMLRPSQSTKTVTLSEGEERIQDGPLADTKEQLGGVFIIDVTTPDAALEWAKQAPSARWGPVEVRPSAIHTVNGVWAA